MSSFNIDDIGAFLQEQWAVPNPEPEPDVAPTPDVMPELLSNIINYMSLSLDEMNEDGRRQELLLSLCASVSDVAELQAKLNTAAIVFNLLAVTCSQITHQSLNGYESQQ